MTSHTEPTTESYNTLYDQDFYGWVIEQVSLLEQRQLDRLDIKNLIQEIASLGRQELRELTNRLKVLLAHLLKWEFQSEKRSRSWQLTIKIQRTEIEQLLKESPSLKSKLSLAIANAFEVSILSAAKETNVPVNTFPEYCHYSVEQILDSHYFPGVD